MTMYVPMMKQADPGLRLLAQMYARLGTQSSSRPPVQQCFEHIRDILYTSASQQEAVRRLDTVSQVVAGTFQQEYAQARDSMQRLIGAQGNPDIWVVGETDGTHHLCLLCSQQEGIFERVRFFSQHERRPLLQQEVSGERRSPSSRCQVCGQPLAPTAFVLFVLTGPDHHGKGCACGRCNRAGTAFLLNLYAYDQKQECVLFPSLYQMIASSKQQCIEQASHHCAQQGWYLLNHASSHAS